MCRIKQNIYFEFVVLKYKVLFSLINQSGKHFVYVVSPIFSIHYFWCNVSCNVFFVWNAFRKYYWSGLNNYQMCFYPLIHSQITCLHWAYCICKIIKLYMFFSHHKTFQTFCCVTLTIFRKSEFTIILTAVVQPHWDHTEVWRTQGVRTFLNMATGW